MRRIHEDVGIGILEEFEFSGIEISAGDIGGIEGFPKDIRLVTRGILRRRI